MHHLKVILSVFALIVVSGVESAPKEDNSDSDIKIDVDEFLTKNEKLVTALIKCIVGETKCTPKEEGFKEMAAKMIRTTCSACKDFEKDIARAVMLFLFNKRPSDFNNIFKKLDPDNKYKPKMIEFMKQKS